MIEQEYKVLRSHTLSDLEAQLEDYLTQGWETIGNVEAFNGVYAQPIRIDAEIEDTEELPQDITLEMDNSEFKI